MIKNSLKKEEYERFFKKLLYIWKDIEELLEDPNQNISYVKNFQKISKCPACELSSYVLFDILKEDKLNFGRLKCYFCPIDFTYLPENRKKKDCLNSESRYKRFFKSDDLSDMKNIVKEIIEKTKFYGYDEYVKRYPEYLSTYLWHKGILKT